MRRWPLPVGAIAMAAAACLGATPPPPPGGHEARPPSPMRPTPLDALAPMVDAIESTAVTFAAPLAGGELIYVQGDDVMLWRLPPEPAVRAGAVTDTGAVLDVARVAGATLVAGEHGLRVVEAEGLLESPLAAALGDA